MQELQRSRISVVARRDVEGTQLEFSGRSFRRLLDKRKFGIRKLLPDVDIVRGDDEKSKSEHVPTGLYHPTDFLPVDLVDAQILNPSAPRRRTNRGPAGAR
jgi:hypothetical protein